MQINTNYTCSESHPIHGAAKLVLRPFPMHEPLSAPPKLPYLVQLVKHATLKQNIVSDSVAVAEGNTVKPVLKTTWEIGTTWELRTCTSVPRSIHYIVMDLRNKTTSEFRTDFHSPLGVPNSQRQLVMLYTFRHIDRIFREKIDWYFCHHSETCQVANDTAYKMTYSWIKWAYR